MEEPTNVFPLLYFGPIAYYRQIAQSGSATFVLNERYSKQTYRSRCVIMGANGELTLSIPVNRPYGKLTRMDEVTVSNATPWQQIHWKSIKSAYGRAPYFEYYADAIQKAITHPSSNLNDYLSQIIEVTFELLDIAKPLVSVFEMHNDLQIQLDKIANGLYEKTNELQPYWQVFQDKHGYKANLSILDLLFNEGPQAQIFIHR